MADAEAEVLRHRLVEELTGQGWLRSPEWRAAFSAVPREGFLPRFLRLLSDRSGFVAVTAGDPDWLELVYRNQAWTTQLNNDDGLWDKAGKGPVQGSPTSSSSAPSIMAHMLESLDVDNEHRVLELGTGTGYNAALLCHRLGAERVTTVDIDAGLILGARQALAEHGYQPTIDTVNGDAGFPGNAPYDRLIAT